MKTETPKVKEINAYTHIDNIFRYYQGKAQCVFLDSSLVNDLGRYSVIALRPYLTLVKNKNSFTVNGKEEKNISFEQYLKEYIEKHKNENYSTLPIISGAVGYFSYDYGREYMKIQSSKNNADDIPDAVLTFYDCFIIEDCIQKKIYISANGITGDSDKIIEKISDEIIKMPQYKEKIHENKYKIQVDSDFDKEEYKAAVRKMIDYIVQGDIYVANMTRQITVYSEKPPEEFFYTLRKNNPSPFGAYLDYNDYQIISASPERFLRVKNGRVSVRPIKGTRRRGNSEEEDRQLRRELENSQKDKSELLMIIDLERNDLNRVCTAGSVKVTELFAVEKYATVFHLVSNIEGTLKEDKTVIDVLQSAFPGGSVTGAPKYRAMEIIDELEHSRRNLYTGSIGYITLSGDCDFNIVIRTAMHKDGKYCLGVGGGITAESDTQFEYEETWQKAKALIEALRD